MKLPGIKYTKPVQSLGRHDINGPIRVANAWSNAADKWGSVITAIDTAEKETDLMAAQARINKQMGRLEGELSSKKSYSIEELDEMNVSYNSATKIVDPATGELMEVEREYIPSHEVSEQIYANSADNILASETDRFKDIKYQNKLKVHHSRLYANGVNKVIVNKNKDRISEVSAKTDLHYEEAVNSGDAVGAGNIAEAALKTGIWTPDHFNNQTIGMESKVRGNQYVIASSATENLSQLQRIKQEALIDESLNPSDRAKSLSLVDSKIGRLNAKLEADIMQARKEKSQQDFIDNVTSIYEQGKPQDWGQVAGTASTMTNGDAKAYISINNSAQTARTNKSSAQIMGRFQGMIRGLSIPDANNTLADRRSHITQELFSALGVDPHGNTTGSPMITPEDFTRLYGQINSATEFNISNPEVKVVGEHIWTTLTGAPKVGMGSFLDQSGVHTILASEAEYDLNTAALNGGPAFDPNIWWRDNQKKYMTKQVVDNINRASDKVKNNIVTDPDTGEVDKKATLDQVRKKRLDGDISDEEVSDIVDTIMMGVQ